jgi:hypothetical protein
MDKGLVHAQLDRVRLEFRQLVDGAGDADLRRLSNGTRWTNRQLLFHMLLGYLIVRALLRLVRIFGRLPRGTSRRFAWLLNAGAKPFDVVNYFGSCLGGSTLSPDHMTTMFDHVIAKLHKRLDAETEADLASEGCTIRAAGIRSSRTT